MRLSAAVDLHIHSTFSDGESTPAELVDLAVSQGLAAISITDHDTAAGTSAALHRAEGKGVEVIPGIEISAWHGDTSMHILGYCFNPEDGRFIERVGFYDPKAPEGREGLRVDMERLAHWKSKGAKLSDTAARLVKQFGSKAS